MRLLMNTLKQELEITNMNSEWLYKNFSCTKKKKKQEHKPPLSL